MKGLRITIKILLILTILAGIGLTIWAFVYGPNVGGDAAQKSAEQGAENGSAVGGAIAGATVGFFVILAYILMGVGFAVYTVFSIIFTVIYFKKKSPSIVLSILVLLLCNIIAGILMLIEHSMSKNIVLEE
ncbi:MAG: hypothetical protein IKP77_04500 [Acholeplasmatales bacterium]|nr:hypothetical protein [Acholeplasmatales bacterium]